MAGWQFWIDRGGTFTDVVACTPDGRLVTHKLLSQNPERYGDPVLQGIRVLLGLGSDEPLPINSIEVVKLGTTVGTNALLERRGVPTALVITAGFGDALRIGDQHRPRIFDRAIKLPEPLYASVVEIEERLNAQGKVLTPLDEEKARQDLQQVYDQGVRALAIVLMHSYRYPDHEQRLAALAQAIGFPQISCSHQVSPLIKLIPRGETTVLDSYLSPLLQEYLNQLQTALGPVPLLIMQSQGGLIQAAQFRGKDSLLSGPAGGVIGAVRIAAQVGCNRIIGFDMGGTSTDIFQYCGVLERVSETEVAGVRLKTPMLHIHTVAAGGGSILSFDGERFRVGPTSAGALPGPWCYGQGGPLTVTDANLLLGRLVPACFPQVFGPMGDLPLQTQGLAAAFEGLVPGHRAEDIAWGFLDVAVANMAQAIKTISVQRGYDLAEYTLVCFGGAAGQVAGLVAQSLGMTRILVHPLAGVLSAYGMGLADRTVIEERSVERQLTPALLMELEQIIENLTQMGAETLAEGDITVHPRLQVRYAGTDTSLSVDFGDLDHITTQFTAQHAQRYGFTSCEQALIVAYVSVEVIAPGPGLVQTMASEPIEPMPKGVFHRASLGVGEVLSGPALIVDRTSTLVVEPGWQVQVLPPGHLLMTQLAPPPRPLGDTTVDPVRLEIFSNLFMTIAEQMGATLQNTSSSVNMKERLDFSCALFDQAGNLIANAPHMPVHLGSMGESVQAVRTAWGDRLQPGEVYALNSPYAGGTHLPDITVVTPVFSNQQPVFYVAARGHHADIGGLSPGSMPPHSQCLEDEGIVIADATGRPFRLIREGQFQAEELLQLLAKQPYPARNPQQNLADLKAQIAANTRGVQELTRMVDHYSLVVVQAYMGHVQDYAAQAVQRTLARLGSGQFTYAMDDGDQICVTWTVDGAGVRVDFSGTSAQVPGNFNAPVAVTKAAVLYVLRTLIDQDIPLNAGCLRPVTLYLPPGSLLNPSPGAAVVAGNVETSQYVTDALYGALGIQAAAQGTMNNFTFGNGRYQYYETICGGSGAGPGYDGTSAVQTHMTNSRLTDPEVLESRFPVLVEAFQIRTGSGGQGLHSGGDGVVRRIRFLEAMTAAIVSDHRRVPPFGLAGGLPGQVGRNWVERVDGSVVPLGGRAEVAMEVGDVFVIETPGGGGYGHPHHDLH